MTDLIKMRGEQIKVQIAGQEINGILIDAGKDILVLYNGRQFLYIPLLHAHQIQQNGDKDDYVDLPTGSPVAKGVDFLSTQMILTNAKVMPSEIYISVDLSFHGYITNVLDDYITFYSPAYKMVYIPIHHFKWLIPYNQNTSLYTISNNSLTVQKSPLHLKVNTSNLPLLPSFEAQLKKEEGKLVIFDGSANPRKVGLLKKVENNFAELVLASGETACFNLSHIKCVQVS